MLTRDLLELMLDIAMARLESGVSPLAGMQCGSVGEAVANIAIKQHRAGISREESWKKRTKG
jgi:hypothetical protein